MAQLQVPVLTLSVTNCSVSVAKKLMYAEASDIGFKHSGMLYDDAADYGVALLNPTTGVQTRWAIIEEVRDPRENELLGWMLVPTPETLRAHPGLTGFQLNIAND